MPAAQLDIEIEQGADFQLNLAWKNGAGTAIDLTGFTARMQVRKTLSAATTLLDLTSAGGNLVLGGTAGTVLINIPAALTNTLTSGGVYDLELVSGSGLVTRLVQGSVSLSPQVTR